MSAKSAFSRSDVAAIMVRMSNGHPGAEFSASSLSHAPASPVAAKIMRDIGVSREKMRQAYGYAKSVVLAQK